MSNSKEVSTFTIAKIASVIIIVGFISLFIFANYYNDHGLKIAGETGLIKSGLFILVLALFPFFLRRNRHIILFVVYATISIIGLPVIYYVVWWNGTKYNAEELLVLGNLLIIDLVSFTYSIPYILNKRRENREKKIEYFNAGRPMRFVIPHGIEGLSTFKRNSPVQIELYPTSIFFRELKASSYSDNANSASLPYLQILDVDVANIQECGNLIMHSEQLPASIIVPKNTQYCIITYLDKVGDEQRLQFKTSLFSGDFRLFMQILKKQIPTRNPTHYDL